MRSELALLLLAALPALAAVDGTVVNGTSGKPASGVQVTLVQPDQTGMHTLATGKTGADGRFNFEQRANGPQLIQVVFDGVTYTKVVPPGAPASGIQVDVFDATKKPVAKVAQDMILLQPTGSEIDVGQTFLLQGDPKLTYHDPAKGAIQFYLPPEANGSVQVTINAPGGMPITRAAEKTAQPNIFKVDYPIKPGETRIDLSYRLPGTPAVFSGKVLHEEGKARLVVPNGVSLKGDNIQDVGKEPQTQASIYDIKAPDYQVEITGTGTLSAPQSNEDSGQPQIQEAPPHIYNNIFPILGLTFAILALGTYLLLNRTQPAAKK